MRFMGRGESRRAAAGSIHSQMRLRSEGGSLSGIHVIAAFGSLGFETWVGAKNLHLVWLHSGDNATTSNNRFFVAVQQMKRTVVQCLQLGDIDPQMSVIVFVDQDQEIVLLVSFQHAPDTNSWWVKKIVDDHHFNRIIGIHQEWFQLA